MSNDSIVKFCSFDNGECCYDSVAVFGNNVAETGNIVAKNGNNVEATFDTVERIVQLVAFDNVASTLLLVWTGLKQSERQRVWSVRQTHVFEYFDI